MVDCILTAAIGESVVLGVAVQQRTEIAAAVQQRSVIDADVLDGTVVAAEVLSRTSLAAAIAQSTVLAAAVLESELLAAEIDLGGLTGWDRQKLDSVDWGATNRAPDVVKLAYASERSNSGGESVDWIGSTTYLEIIQFLVPQPAWRANGYIEFDVTGSFFNGSGTGTETVTFEIQRSNPWPTDVGEPAATFGLPQSWTTVGTFTSGAIAVGAGIGLLSFTLRIRANPHTGTTFRQVWSGEMIWSDLSGGDPDFRKFINRTTIDVTEDQILRLRFKTDFTPTADVAFVAKSASAILMCPRDGSDI